MEPDSVVYIYATMQVCFNDNAPAGNRENIIIKVFKEANKSDSDAGADSDA